MSNFLSTLQAMTDYPPTHKDIQKFFETWLDHVVLEWHGVHTFLSEKCLDYLLTHIRDEWDWGACRTVHLYFEGTYEPWGRFVLTYYRSLIAETLKDYSAYAVWLAREVTFEYEQQFLEMVDWQNKRLTSALANAASELCLAKSQFYD